MNNSPDVESTQPAAALPSLVAGYLVWIAMTLIIALFAPGGGWTAVGDYWLIGFLAGALVCFLFLVRSAMRDQWKSPLLLGSFAAYALPVALLIVGWQVMCSIFLAPAQDQAFHSLSSIVMLIGTGIGLLLAFWLGRGRGHEQLVGAVLPPAVMALAALVYFGAGTFTSDEFRYRDAFSFGLLSAKMRGNDLAAECIFNLHKAGEYQYSISPLGDEMMNEYQPGEIVWGEEKSAPTQPGDHEVTLIWRDVLKPGTTAAMSTEPYFSISRKVGDRSQIIQSFTIPLDSGIRRAMAGAVLSGP